MVETFLMGSIGNYVRGSDSQGLRHRLECSTSSLPALLHKKTMGNFDLFKLRKHWLPNLSITACQILFNGLQKCQSASQVGCCGQTCKKRKCLQFCFSIFSPNEITCRMHYRAPERGQVLAFQPHPGAACRCRF